MKRDLRLQTAGFGFLTIVLYLCSTVYDASAVSNNPYEAIVGRNVFGLKPPTVTALPTVAPVAAAVTFKLLGISTILDRKQVLLKVMTAARPPELAKTQSYLWGEGQGEDDVEVVAIDAVLGMVTIKNRGETVPLTMKEHAEKPAVGAALPGPAVTSLQLPTPAGAPAATPVPPAIPGGRTIPTRSLRTSSTDGAGLGAGATVGSVAGNGLGQPSPAGQRSIEENVALYEINRAKNEALIQSGVKLPRMPPHVLLKPTE